MNQVPENSLPNIIVLAEKLESINKELWFAQNQLIEHLQRVAPVFIKPDNDECPKVMKSPESFVERLDQGLTDLTHIAREYTRLNNIVTQLF